MNKFIIKDQKTLQTYLKTISTPIIGVGARPFHATIGLRNAFPNFELLVCKGTTKDAPMLENNIKITYLDNDRNDFRTAENFDQYQTKTPDSILQDEKMISYLNSFSEKPALLFFKMTPLLEELAKNAGCIAIGNHYQIYEKYENKINFQNLLDSLGISSPNHAVVAAEKLNYNYLRSIVGDRFVIQLSLTSIEPGTFFILEPKDWTQVMKRETMKLAISNKEKFRVTRFIDRACSPSMAVCVTKSGVLRTGLQKQIIDAKEVIEEDRRSGVYCGHDWTKSIFEEKIQKQAAEIADRIGIYFKEKENFQGIFGIDFVLEKETDCLYPIEANIRLLGTFPLITMLQENAHQPLIQALQIIDCLDRDDYELDIDSLNKAMAGNKIGAQLNIHSRDNKPMQVTGDIRPGIYKVNINSGKVTFLRDGIFFEDLRAKNEIILGGSVPKKGRVYLRHNAICKLITKNSFLNDSDKLNEFAKIMVKYVYKKLALRPVE